MNQHSVKTTVKNTQVYNKKKKGKQVKIKIESFANYTSFKNSHEGVCEVFSTYACSFSVSSSSSHYQPTQSLILQTPNSVPVTETGKTRMEKQGLRNTETKNQDKTGRHFWDYIQLLPLCNYWNRRGLRGGD